MYLFVKFELYYDIYNLLKKNQLTEGLFYISCFVIAIISIFFDLIHLRIVIPAALFLILIIYLEETIIRKKEQVNVFFIISVLVYIIIDYLTYTDYKFFFTYICLLLFMYSIFASLSLKKHLVSYNSLKNKGINVSIIFTFGFLVYLIYAICNIVTASFPNSLLLVTITALGLLVYAIISYYIFHSDVYAKGTNVIISLIICIFYVSFTVLLYEMDSLKHIFTVLITIPHIIGIYMFMRFLVNQNPKEIQSVDNKFV